MQVARGGKKSYKKTSIKTHVMKYNLLEMGNFCAPKHGMLFQFCNM
jgi:hypothetical protein